MEEAMTKPIGLTNHEAAKESAPKADGATVKVAPCSGCGQLPHGSVNARIACLEQALARSRVETAPMRARVAALSAENFELRLELSGRDAT